MMYWYKFSKLCINFTFIYSTVMFNSNKSEAVRPTEICNMANFKLLMVGIFYLSCN